MSYFPPFDSLPSAADLEAAKHANDWNIKPCSAPVANNKPQKHQQNQGYLTGASRPQPTNHGENDG